MELKREGVDPGYAKYCDHTVLRAYTTRETVKKFCEEAKKYGAAAVCVNPVHVALVKQELEGSGVKTATVIGFPLGANKTCVKVFEAAEAVADGADEVDMVINIGALREGDTEYVLRDISEVVQAAKNASVKVIIETCYLTDEEKEEACRICIQAGAAYVKTSTGMGTGGATAHDIWLLKKAVGGKAKIKASGGVDNREKAYEMLCAGADRLGVSRVPQIVEDDMSLFSAAVGNHPPQVV